LDNAQDLIKEFEEAEAKKQLATKAAVDRLDKLRYTNTWFPLLLTSSPTPPTATRLQHPKQK
jgi:hypothetical protein